MSVSSHSNIEDKDDSSPPVKHDTQQDGNPRQVKNFKNGERGPRSSQSSDYSERRKFGGDRNASRGWRGNGRRYGGGRGGYDRRRGSFNNRRYSSNSWRDNRRNPDFEPGYSDTNLYVANLPEEWDDKKLASVFVEFGEIESAAIMHANRDDRQRIAFVNFNEAECAKTTIQGLHQKKFGGHPDPDRGLIVKKAYLKRPGISSGRSGDRGGRRFDRNSSHNNSMQGAGHFPGNQSHPSSASGGMNHNKNIQNINKPTSRRPPSGPSMGMQSQASQPPPPQQPFPPTSVDNRNQMPPHGSNTEQLIQQMGSNWGPNTAPERHQRNPPSGRNSYQGMPQQHQPQQVHPHRHSNQQAQQQQHQQPYMMQVVPQMPQMANYPYMLDAQGNPMQMQVMDQNGNMVPVMFPSQPMQQTSMQLMNVQTASGEWVQQMVPVQQPHQVPQMQPQQMQMQQHIDQQGNPVPTQMMHG